MSKYEIRELKTSDIFIMSKILKKMDIKLSVDKDITQEQMGVELIQKIIENLHLAENEVNEFISGLIGITPQEFSDLPLTEVAEIFNQLKGLKNISAFLKLAGK